MKKALCICLIIAAVLLVAGGVCMTVGFFRNGGFPSLSGKEFEENSSGDGQYDAFVKALRKIYKNKLNRSFPTLDNYYVTIPPGGRTDALVQTVITWRNGDKLMRTRGLDADQTESAIKATFKMLNMIEDGNGENNKK